MYKVPRSLGDNSGKNYRIGGLGDTSGRGYGRGSYNGSGFGQNFYQDIDNSLWYIIEKRNMQSSTLVFIPVEVQVYKTHK